MIEIRSVATFEGTLFALYVNRVEIAVSSQITFLESLWEHLKNEKMRYKDEKSADRRSRT